MKNKVLIGSSQKLTLDLCKRVARDGAQVDITAGDILKVKKSHKYLKDLFDKKTLIYGLNTQFGSQAHVLDKNILKDESEYFTSVYDRQVNLIRSFNCSLGIEAPEEIVRATMLLRANCLSLAHSGVRPLVIEKLIKLLNSEVHPVINRYGSIGASGDLIPLSAIAATLISEETAEVNFKNQKTSAKKALASIDMEKLEPEMREGIALINGTSYMTSIAALSLYDLHKLYPQMLSALAMVLESLRVIDAPYDSLVHKLKNHQGEIDVNEFFVNFWKGSKLVRSMAEINSDNLNKIKADNTVTDFKNLQDFYSLRSVPQGFGPMEENLKKAD